MRTKNLLKLALTMVAMFVMTGAMAQITLTVKNADGTAANGAILYTVNSSTSAAVDLATDGGAGDSDATENGVIVYTPASNGQYNFMVRLGAARNAYSVDYSGATSATITLRTEFAETAGAGAYVANNIEDKVTINKPMPYFVWPSPIHNPSWAAPATEFAVPSTTGLQSTFTWTATGLTPASITNYVELTFTTTGLKTITTTEEAAAAYGSCAAPTVNFFVTAINPPFAKINETFSTVLGLTNVIADGCAPQNKNISVAFDNASEEFPYFIAPAITAYNYDLNGTGDGLINQSAGIVISAEDLTAPISMAAAGELIAAADYAVLNDRITVYEIDINKWNAKISRKSDYVAIRDGSLDKTAEENYTYYTAATSGQPGVDVTVARIIVMPNPVTGPIYHISNAWGL